MWRLDALCEYLAAQARNASLLALWNTAAEPTTLRGVDRDKHAFYDYVLWTEETPPEPSSLTLNDSALNATAEPAAWYDAILDITHTRFRELTEWYAIPGVAVLGMLSNLVALVLVGHFQAMRRNGTKLHLVLLVVDTVYLALSLGFTQLRHYGLPGPHKLELLHYFTAALSAFQFLSVWVLYVAATDAYRYFNSFRKASSLVKLGRTPRNLALAFVAALVLHVPFLPPVRVLLWEARDTLALHDPCTAPIEQHWNFSINEVPSNDLFYVLFFMLVHYLLWYACAVFQLGCRDKDLLDCLQTMQERHGLPLIALQAGHTAFVTSTLCTASLLCLVPKLTLMTFKLFEFAVDYMAASHHHFLYVNEVANLLLVVRAGVYLPVLLRYSPYSRHLLWRLCCSACRRYAQAKETKDVPIIKVNQV